MTGEEEGLTIKNVEERVLLCGEVDGFKLLIKLIVRDMGPLDFRLRRLMRRRSGGGDRGGGGGGREGRRRRSVIEIEDAFLMATSGLSQVWVIEFAPTGRVVGAVMSSFLVLPPMVRVVGVLLAASFLTICVL